MVDAIKVNIHNEKQGLIGLQNKINEIIASGVGGVTDHGALTGLADDDHSQYSLVAGTRAFTGTVSGITPTATAHLATKGYVDGLTGVPATFEWDAGRHSASGTSFETVSFNSTFSTPPVVVAMREDKSGGGVFNVQVGIGSANPLTGFRLRSVGAAEDIHWFACTAGEWLVNGLRISARTIYPSATKDNVWFARPFTRTPAVLTTAMTNGFASNGTIDTAASFIPYGSDTIDVDAFNVGGINGMNLTSYATQAPYAVICIEPTSAAIDNGASGNITWAASGSFKSGHKYEAGMFYKSATTTGTITYSSAFSGNPSVILHKGTSGAAGTEDICGDAVADFGTTSVAYENAAVGANGSYIYFFATDRGFNSTTGYRL